MLMPTATRKKILEYLFHEGVCVAKKDTHAKQHPHIEGVSNLFVMKAMQSLVSRGYVKEQYAWRHFYWTLTEEGIVYLREVLSLPESIIPATYKRAQRSDAPMPQARRDPYAKPGAYEGEQREYRGDDKQAEVGVGAGQMEFSKAGFGRGRPL